MMPNRLLTRDEAMASWRPFLAVYRRRCRLIDAVRGRQITDGSADYPDGRIGVTR